MNYALILALFVCLVGVTFALDCGWYCLQNYDPVCGQRTEEGNVVRRIFGNQCEMDSANDCKEGWVPCTQ